MIACEIENINNFTKQNKENKLRRKCIKRLRAYLSNKIILNEMAIK